MSILKQQKTGGYMLIELLVVIATIFLLASFLLANLMDARERAQNTKIVSEARSIQSALGLYFSDHGAYPFLGDFDVHCVTAGCVYEGVARTNSTLQSALATYLHNGAGVTPKIELEIGGVVTNFQGIAYQCLVPTDNGQCERAILLIPTFGDSSDNGYGFSDGRNTISSQYAGDTNEIDAPIESSNGSESSSCSATYNYLYCAYQSTPGCGEGWTDGSECGSSSNTCGEYYNCSYQGSYNCGEGWTDGSQCGSSSSSSESSSPTEYCYDSSDNDGDTYIDGCDTDCSAGANGYCAQSSSDYSSSESSSSDYTSSSESSSSQSSSAFSVNSCPDASNPNWGNMFFGSCAGYTGTGNFWTRSNSCDCNGVAR